MSKDSVCSLLAEAIADEAGAPKLYNRLISTLKNPEDKKLIQDIINHERKHKVDFERMYKKHKCRGRIGKSAKKGNHYCIPAAMPL